MLADLAQRCAIVFDMSSPEWRDRHGKRLVDYPRPSVAVDVAVLSLDPGVNRLGVVLHRRDPDDGWGDWSLPGTFVHEGERLQEAALRALEVKAGIAGLHPRQLHVFDDPQRDPRGWVISVAHVDVVPYSRLEDAVESRDDVRLASVAAPRAKLPYDHRQIIAAAVDDVRARYESEPDPFGLLEASEFTLLELRRVHEAVRGVRLQKDTFRRHMEEHLEPIQGRFGKGVGRPATLYRRKKRTTRSSP